MKRSFLIHFAELTLKGKNRAFFERILAQNIRAKIKGRLKKEFGRFVLEAEDEDVEEKLAKIPGISDFAPTEIVEKDWGKIKEKAKELAPYLNSPFRIVAKRSDKSFVYNSLEIEQKLALVIKENFPRLKPSFRLFRSTLYVIIGQKRAFLFVKKVKGVGGLPVGASGKAFAFLSGGIDSAVASFLAMKRGIKVEFLHFFNETEQKEGVKSKIETLVKKLGEFQPQTTAWLLPFGEVQRRIIGFCPEKLRMIVYRRAMFKIANLFASSRKIKAYITGDSVGQVASQTLPNLQVIWQVADLPVLAPLVGFNKEETIELAKKIGTFEISILPYQDCCRFMIAKHPETHARIKEIETVEEMLEKREWEKLFKEAIEKREKIEV